MSANSLGGFLKILVRDSRTQISLHSNYEFIEPLCKTIGMSVIIFCLSFKWNSVISKQLLLSHLHV